jgi:hypothetical protein
MTRMVTLPRRLAHIQQSYGCPVAVTVALDGKREPYIIHTERLKDFLSHPERDDDAEDVPEKFKELRGLEYFG